MHGSAASFEISSRHADEVRCALGRDATHRLRGCGQLVSDARQFAADDAAKRCQVPFSTRAFTTRTAFDVHAGADPAHESRARRIV